MDVPELYKLRNDAISGQLGGPPFIIGSALRVPSYAYVKWNIRGHPGQLREDSLTVYQDEFGDTSPAWMASVVEAARRGGIGDRPQILRQAVGRTAAKVTEQMLQKQPYVRLLDVGCGAGGSLSAYIAELEKLDPSYLERVILSGVDLSRKSIWKAGDDLESRGFHKGDNLYLYHSRDFEMGEHVAPESQDVIINVAGIHAASDISPTFRAIARTLKPGRLFVSGDWHHAMWDHPRYTYKLLDEMDAGHFEWANKGAFMDEFAYLFPRAKGYFSTPQMDPADARAIEEIGRYWRDGWAEVRLEKIKSGQLLPQDEQIVLEGHRPVEEYVLEGKKAGLTATEGVVYDGILHANPQQVVEGTNLNMVLVLRKN
jgi:SAM-dependent methyltransferase